MKWFINYLIKNDRLNVIKDRDGVTDYMHRYYLWKNSKNIDANQSNKPKANLFLHNFRASDDPYHHDHPWPWGRLILKGGYWEHTGHFENGEFVEDKVRWCGPGSFAFKKATDFHWVELPKDHNNNTWTLFFHGKRTRKWGFLDTDTPGTKKNPIWRYYRDFLAKRNQGVKKA